MFKLTPQGSRQGKNIAGMEPYSEGHPVAGCVLIGQANQRGIQVNPLNEAASYPRCKA
jgi:hypothetical protein